MNIDDLAKHLEPWMRVETWHTTHPLDQERFHKALANAIRDLGTQITFDDFKDAMETLHEKHHSDKNIESFESDIDRYATNAESIASYLYDTENT